MQTDLTARDQRTYCVYLITNMVNGKQYVGQTCKGTRARWSAHKCDAKKGSNFFFHCAIRRYGVDSFRVSVLRERLTKREADAEERSAIKVLRLTDPDFGYNLAPGGEGGGVPSEAALKRLKDACWITRRDIQSEEVAALYRSGMSTEQLAQHFNTTPRTITRRLVWAAQPLRTSREGLDVLYGRTIDDQQIIQLYRNGLNTHEIGTEYGISPTTVVTRLRASGESIRNISESHLLAQGVEVDTKAVVAAYRSGKSTQLIAEECGVSAETIRHRLIAANEPRRPNTCNWRRKHYPPRRKTEC